MSILTHDEAKRLSQSSTDPLEVIRNVEAAVIIKLAGSQNAPKDEIRLIWKPKCDALRQQLEAAQAEVKHLNLHLKATQSGRDAALARLAEIEADASTQPKMVTPYITQEHFNKTFPVNVRPSHAHPPVEPSQARVVEPFEVDWPEYHQRAMGCGLEDRGIRDRYEAMQYGWDQAIERVAERLPETLYATPQAAAQPPAPSEAAHGIKQGGQQ